MESSSYFCNQRAQGQKRKKAPFFKYSKKRKAYSNTSSSSKGSVVSVPHFIICCSHLHCIAKLHFRFPSLFCPAVVFLSVQSWLQQQQIVVLVQLRSWIQSCRPGVQEHSRRCVSRQEAGLPCSSDPSNQPQTLFKTSILTLDLKLPLDLTL